MQVLKRARKVCVICGGSDSPPVYALQYFYKGGKRVTPKTAQIRTRGSVCHTCVITFFPDYEITHGHEATKNRLLELVTTKSESELARFALFYEPLWCIRQGKRGVAMEDKDQLKVIKDCLSRSAVTKTYAVLDCLEVQRFVIKDILGLDPDIVKWNMVEEYEWRKGSMQDIELPGELDEETLLRIEALRGLTRETADDLECSVYDMGCIKPGLYEIEMIGLPYISELLGYAVQQGLIPPAEYLIRIFW